MTLLCLGEGGQLLRSGLLLEFRLPFGERHTVDAFARQIGMLPPDGSGADRAMKSAFNAATKLRRAVAERRSA